VSIIFISSPAFAQHQYSIDVEQSSIQGSIRYTLIGNYEAKFGEFSGTIYYDPNNLADSSVALNIQTKSIKSKHPVLDRIVRSKRLLDSKKFP